MSGFGHGEIQFNAENHTYWYEGQEFVGVSKLMTDQGLRKAGFWEADEVYRKRGQAVHLACRYVQEGTYSEEGTHPKIVQYVRGYQKFIKDTGFKATLLEEPVFSVASRTAGTLDQYGYVPGGEEWILDLKSGVVPVGVGIQLGGYRHMLREMRGLVPVKAKAIRLEEDGKYTVKDYSGQVWVNYWLSAVGLWKFREANGLLR